MIYRASALSMVVRLSWNMRFSSKYSRIATAFHHEVGKDEMVRTDVGNIGKLISYSLCGSILSESFHKWSFLLLSLTDVLILHLYICF